jgi:hypothetical protein
MEEIEKKKECHDCVFHVGFSDGHKMNYRCIGRSHIYRLKGTKHRDAENCKHYRYCNGEGYIFKEQLEKNVIAEDKELVRKLLSKYEKDNVVDFIYNVVRSDFHYMRTLEAMRKKIKKIEKQEAIEREYELEEQN